MSERRRIKYMGLERLFRTMNVLQKGARRVFIHEAAFRQELCLAAISILACLFFFDGWFSLLAVVSSWLLVLMIEVLNTAAETVVDRISLEQRPLSGAAKNPGSLAVTLSLINALGWRINAVF